jgi:3-methyladenine DNA glycosylase AlkC
MAAFKDEINLALARSLAAELRGAWPAFPTRRFTHHLSAALEPLELLARVELLADRLAGALPESFVDASAVLWHTLQSPTFTGWMTLPCGTFVARQGIDQPEIALPLLAGLTPRWSSEGAIRPFIERHPDITYERLRRWCTDEDEHVRRLVSEGTRPRLPWAPRLRGLVSDPSPNVPLLDALVDDPSQYVRRSVANHLNDISKDHPDVALDLADRWMTRGAGAVSVVRHGLRTLVKRGDRRALELFGATTTTTFELVDLVLDRDEVAIGEAITFSFTLALPRDSRTGGDAIIDYRVHYAGVRGMKAPKVFKLTRRRVEPGTPITLSRRHPFEHVSIRRIHPGPHLIDIQVNGVVLGSAKAEVIETDERSRSASVVRGTINAPRESS